MTRLALAVLLLTLAACATRPDAPPWHWPESWRDTATALCEGDGAPPPLGESTSGGDLAACQTLVRGGYR